MPALVGPPNTRLRFWHRRRPSSGEAGARHTTPALATAHIAEPSLIDCEEDRTLRAVLVGMLREGDR